MLVLYAYFTPLLFRYFIVIFRSLQYISLADHLLCPDLTV